MKRIQLIAAITILLISALLAACSNKSAQEDQVNQQENQPTQSSAIIMSNSIGASGKVVASKYANLSFMIGAQEFNLNVQLGDKVKDGDVLAVLADDALPKEIILAEGDLVGAQQILDDLLLSQTASYQAEQAMIQAEQAVKDAEDDLTSEKYPRASDDYIQRIKARIDIATKEVADAEEEYDKVDDRKDGDEIKAQALLRLTNARLDLKSLKNQLSWYTESSDPLDVSEKKAALSVAQSIFEDAQREYERLKGGTDPNKLAAATAKVDSLKSIINLRNLVAPFDGTIVEIYGKSGESITAGVPLILLADLSTLQIQTTDLSEVDIARINIGDPVSITFDALPGFEIEGKVNNIALKNSSGSGVYYTVTVAMNEIPKELRWGMSAYVEIEINNE